MIVDIIIILAFLLCIIIGAKKGFAKTVLGLCSYVVSVILGVMFFDMFKSALYSYAPAAEKIELFRQSISGTIEAYVNNNAGELPAFLQTYINTLSGDFAAGISATVVEALIAVVFIVVLIVVTKLVSAVICRLVKLPVLKQFNSILGGAVGAVNGVIVCYIAGAVLVFSLINTNNGWITEQLEASVLGAYFFKNNIILNVLVGL